MKKKKGISLIVLVITIIVMIILAAAIIIALNNSGIIGKASAAVKETDFKTVKELAELAWGEAYAAGVRTVEDIEVEGETVKGFKTRVEEKLAANKVDQTKYKITVTTSGVTVEKITEDGGTGTPSAPDPALNHSGIIPEGATYTILGFDGKCTHCGIDVTSNYSCYCGKYTKSDNIEECEECKFNFDRCLCGNYSINDIREEQILVAGDMFPEKIHPVDIYKYGDYTYVYSAGYIAPEYTAPVKEQYVKAGFEGWLVTIRQETPDGTNKPYQLKKESYGQILESINGFPIKSMEETFSGCTSLTDVSSLKIPGSVTNMNYTFGGCTSITDISSLKIPGSVTNMDYTFGGCTSLTDVNGIKISEGVAKMQRTFSGCTSLRDVSGLTIPGSVTDISYIFEGCTLLTDVNGLKIPGSVTTMFHTFDGCTSLRDVSGLTIPGSVTNMNFTFSGCTALTNVSGLKISEGVTSMYYTFSSCTALTDISSLTIPGSVTDMTGTFHSCKNLKGSITINTTPNKYSYCLKGTGITEILGNCQVKDEILATK